MQPAMSLKYEIEMRESKLTDSFHNIGSVPMNHFEIQTFRLTTTKSTTTNCAIKFALSFLALPLLLIRFIVNWVFSLNVYFIQLESNLFQSGVFSHFDVSLIRMLFSGDINQINKLFLKRKLGQRNKNENEDENCVLSNEDDDAWIEYSRGWAKGYEKWLSFLWASVRSRTGLYCFSWKLKS